MQSPHPLSFIPRPLSFIFDFIQFNGILRLPDLITQMCLGTEGFLPKNQAYRIPPKWKGLFSVFFIQVSPPKISKACLPHVPMVSKGNNEVGTKLI